MTAVLLSVAGILLWITAFCFFYSFLELFQEKRWNGWLVQEDETKMRGHGAAAGALFTGGFLCMLLAFVGCY